MWQVVVGGRVDLLSPFYQPQLVTWASCGQCCAFWFGTRIFQKEYVEGNKKVYRKMKRTKELLVGAF